MAKGYVTVELKICEDCGGLFLRSNAKRVYCNGCSVKLAPPPPASVQNRAPIAAR